MSALGDAGRDLDKKIVRESSWREGWEEVRTWVAYRRANQMSFLRPSIVLRSTSFEK